MAKTEKLTIQEKDAFVGVWSPESGFYFCIPWEGYKESDVPKGGLALIAAVMRLDNDPEFFDECLKWLEEKKKEAS